jgi:aminoglycoside 6-adenylyltransferase
MDRTALGYESLIQEFVSWAQSETDIRAAMIIGSRARTDHPADEWSDLDIVLFVNTPQHYVDSADWVKNVAPFVLTFLEVSADGSWERRVLFDGGFDVDFAIIPTSHLEPLVAATLPPLWADVFRRGVRILLDKDGFLVQLQKRPLPDILMYRPPSEREFLNVVNDFWYHAVWTAKHLRRGELWWAKSGCDDRLKNLLRQVLEWHAHAMKGLNHDTWMRGRFLEEWVDPRALEQLGKAFAHYDEDDVWRALFVTMDTFRWLSIETAERLGHSYPTTGEEQATEFVKKLYARKG